MLQAGQQNDMWTSVALSSSFAAELLLDPYPFASESHRDMVQMQNRQLVEQFAW